MPHRKLPLENNEDDLLYLKNRFVSMASHEFRTPLTSIASSAELVDAYVSRGEYEMVSKHVARIKKCVRDMDELLADFLSLDKLEKGKARAQYRLFNLRELVIDICDDLSPLLKPGQTIIREYTGSETVFLDPILLKIVLQNLISNASKYSGENIPIQVDITALPENLTIRVIDQGIGIPLSDQCHIFRCFYRAQNAENISGIGLGLYITKSYIDLMQGEIGFSSVAGEGTTFWVAFKTTS